MEYLTSELYINYFFGKDYKDHQDKFLIGILNKDKNKLKDVITGEIVESWHFTPITRLKGFKNGGNNMAIGYITGFKGNQASIHQKIVAEKVNAILTKNVLDEEDITKIKNIMNREIRNDHKKSEKKEKRRSEKQQKLQKYSIDESQRNF